MIHEGHPPHVAWGYTPKRIEAFLFLAEKRRTMERVEEVTLAMMANRDDSKEVNKILKKWTAE